MGASESLILISNGSNPNKQINLRRTTYEKVLEILQQMGEPSYRVKQLQEWLWVKGKTDFTQMSNLGDSLIKKLQDWFYISKLKPEYQEISSDKTVKIRFKTEDNYSLESVYIPSKRRNTLCVSSQIGCSLNCRFCFTARLENKRNLFFDEIIDQFRWGNEISMTKTGKPLTNIVFMGMGEPLLNYRNVVRAISFIVNPKRFNFISEKQGDVSFSSLTTGMSPKRITVSTAGIVQGIYKLGDDHVPFELALSLHVANNAKRSQIMMNNPRNDLKQLRNSLQYFYQCTGNKITLEYLLLAGINDSEADAQSLIKFYRQTPAKLVNIIEYNPVPEIDFKKPENQIFYQFVKRLQLQGINVQIRRSRGKDISAACGQLANIQKKSTRIPYEP